MNYNIHQSIMEKLKYFYKTRKIPNIIFHGESGNGKRTIVNDFINIIYNHDKEQIKNYVMYVNCAHGKGIKFIREELKFFAKTHINSNGGDNFKSIILFNADKLTIDAQSALRRCIELFNHTTRFFIIVEDKYKLLKPILSRFCEIYIPEPVVNDKYVNLYQHILDQTFKMREQKHSRDDWLHKYLLKNKENMNIEKIMIHSTKLYEKGYSGLDLIKYIDKKQDLPLVKKYELLFTFHKIRKEFRNEKLLIMFILNFLFLSLEYNLENISFM
jgi:hypothetical protein